MKSLAPDALRVVVSAARPAVLECESGGCLVRVGKEAKTKS
jgi:hypothetical protein